MNKRWTCLAMCFGGGTAIVLYVIFGVLPGTYISGIIGLNMAGQLYGSSQGSAPLTRFIALVFMMAGFALSAVILAFLAAMIIKTGGLIQSRLARFRDDGIFFPEAKTRKS